MYASGEGLSFRRSLVAGVTELVCLDEQTIEMRLPATRCKLAIGGQGRILSSWRSDDGVMQATEQIDAQIGVIGNCDATLSWRDAATQSRDRGAPVIFAARVVHVAGCARSGLPP